MENRIKVIEYSEFYHAHRVQYIGECDIRTKARLPMFIDLLVGGQFSSGTDPLSLVGKTFVVTHFPHLSLATHIEEA